VHGEAEVRDEVPVEEVCYRTFEDLSNGLPEGRFDIVYWVMGALPTRSTTTGDSISELEVVQAWRNFLSTAQTRAWIVDLQGTKEDVGSLDTWACAVTEGGGPPAVVLPSDWSQPYRETFLRGLQLGLINGSRLSTATWQALLESEADCSPRLFMPRNGDNGLNLGRLLEQHRNHIEKLDADYRTFGRRLEADVPPEGSLGFDAWREMSESLPETLQELERLADRQASVAQERTPRGWVELQHDIERAEELNLALENQEETLHAALIEPMMDPETRTDLMIEDSLDMPEPEAEAEPEPETDAAEEG